MEQVSLIDSVGLTTLVGGAKRTAAHGGSLQVACAVRPADAPAADSAAPSAVITGSVR
jgi:anti-anti-sigma regulatory factor